MNRASWNSLFWSTPVIRHNMFKKAESSFYVCFGKVILILLLGIWTNHAEFCEDTFTIYNDKTMTVSNDVTIHNSMSSFQCIAKCRSNVKCCAASYSEATMACHLDISGTCNAVKTSASNWITMTRDNFGEYNN
jgi:hypothetical protein